MTFSNWMTSRLDRGLSGETLSRRAARFRCSRLVSTIGSGRSSAAATGAPTDLLGECDLRKLTLELKSPGCPRALSFGTSGTVAQASDGGSRPQGALILLTPCAGFQ